MNQKCLAPYYNADGSLRCSCQQPFGHLKKTLENPHPPQQHECSCGMCWLPETTGLN